jgi:serine/threonine-protein kinase
VAYELLTGQTPFRGDSTFSVACQRLNSDVPPPSTAIDGVPGQFDKWVACATARDPADRYADACQMAGELDEIVDELALPEFLVPAPRNCAEHRAASPHHPTRRLPRVDSPAADEYELVSGQFAGIEWSEFVLASQHARRMALIWIAVVLAVTGLIASAAWTIGSNLAGLL